MATFKPPTQSQLNEVLRRIPTLSLRRAFFEALRNPLWVAPLANEGMFDNPPEPEITSDGLIRDHYWPEIDYLTRAAPDVPAAVVDVLLNLKSSSNPWVRGAAFRIGTSIPANEAARLKPLLTEWSKTGFGWRANPPEMVALAVNLLNGGHRKAGIAVANLLFRPKTSEGTRNPELVFDEYWYEECLPTIVAALGDDAIRTVLPWLEEYERATGHLTEDFEMTDVARPSIRHDPDRFSSAEHALIDAVRDAAVIAMNVNPATTKVMLARSPMVLTRRITLYAATEALKLRSGPDEQPPETLLSTATELLADSNFREDACRTECCELARETAKYSAAALMPFVAFISAGPKIDYEDVRERLAGFYDDESPDALESRLQELIDTWKHRWLAGIGIDALPPELRDLLVELDNQRGPMDSPLVPLNSVRTWSGPSSPLTQDEMSVMSAEELAAHLESWRAGEVRGPAPSHEGQGRELTALVTTNPHILDGVAGLVERFRPIYVRSILQGWETALKAGLELDWTWVAEMIQQVLSHADESRFLQEGDDFHDDGDFRGAKKSAVNLLEELVKKRDSLAIPEAAVLNFATLLIVDAEDDTAWTEYESHKGDTDALTLSLNLRWPIRVHGLLNLVAHGRDSPWFQAGLAAFEEVLAMPDVHGASRAVLGEGLGRLLTVAPDWIQSRAAELFGTQDGLTRNQQIAVTTAMAVHGYHKKLYAFLEPSLVGSLGAQEPLVSGWKGRTDPLQRVGEWAIYAVIFGHQPMGNPVADAFFNSADPKVRGQAMGRIAWSMTNINSVDEDILTRLAALWDARVQHVRSHPNDSLELNEFHWYVRSKQYDAAWWLPRLKEALELSPTLAAERFMISKEIASAAEADPRGAFEITKLLLDGRVAAGLQVWDLSRNAMPVVIARARQSGDPELEREAIQMMNKLGEDGYSALEGEVTKVMMGEITEDDLDEV